MTEFFSSTVLFIILLWPVVCWLNAYSLSKKTSGADGDKFKNTWPFYLGLFSVAVIFNGIEILAERVDNDLSWGVQAGGFCLLVGLMFIYGEACSSRVEKMREEEKLRNEEEEKERRRDEGIKEPVPFVSISDCDSSEDDWVHISYPDGRSEYFYADVEDRRSD